MSPRFSVLLPTHNRADLLGYAIRSVLWQTEGDFELLVVGDGCTDDSAKVVAGFGDARIRWFDLPKAPHYGYANRNVALRQAAGEYIAFMAHDDLVLPDHLALLADTIERSAAEWVYSRPLWVSADGVVVPFAGNLRNADELDVFLTTRNHIPASCVLHRRSCLDKYGYWPEDVPFAADWRYWIRIIEGGRRANLAYCPTPSVLHFRAAWRDGRAGGMPQLAAALELADRASWWPAALKMPIAAGALEQQVFHDAIKSDGYVEALRAGVTRVVERLAWDRLDETPGVLATHRATEQQLREVIAGRDAELAQAKDAIAAHAAEISRLRAAYAEQARETTAAKAQLQRTYDSTSWKLTAPLRALRRALGSSPRLRGEGGEH